MNKNNFLSMADFLNMISSLGNIYNDLSLIYHVIQNLF